LHHERNGNKIIIIIIIIIDYVARIREMRGTYRVLVGKPEGKKPLWKIQA
jgi:hypothetical protein